MKKIVGVLVALCLAVGVWWYASPLWTLHEMRQAAKAGDAQKLSEYVDYPALRENLKSEFRRGMTNEMAKHADDGFAMFGSALALAVVNPVIDAMVTPEGVQAMFDQRKQLDRVAPAKAKMPAAPQDPIVDREGFSEFVVRDKDPTKGSLVFKRSGLGWKLSGIAMPPGTFGSGNEVKS
jgi:hypothetical protein